MTRWLEITETDTNYEAYTEFQRRVDAELGFPARSARTTRTSDRYVNAGTPSSMFEIPDDLWTAAQVAMTAGEISATVTSKPGGYSVSNTSTIYWRSVPYSARRIIITDGDSLISTANSPWDLPEANRVYKLIEDGLGDAVTSPVLNVGLGGELLEDMITTSTTKIHDLVFPEGHQEATVVIWGGSNDITNNGKTGAQTFAFLETYVDALWANMPDLDRVIVCTPIARLDASTTSTLSDYRDLIIDPSEISAHGYEVADLGALAEFDLSDWTVVNNTTYFQADKEHPTATGTPIIANCIVDALNV